MILRSPALSVLSSLFSFELGMMSSVAVWPRFSPVAAFLGHGFPFEAVVCRGVCRFGECGGRSRSLSLFWEGTGSLSAKLLSETFVRGAGSIALRPMFNELSARKLTTRKRKRTRRACQSLGSDCGNRTRSTPMNHRVILMLDLST